MSLAPGEWVNCEARNATPEQHAATKLILAALRTLRSRDEALTILTNALVSICRHTGVSLGQAQKMIELVWNGMTTEGL